MPSSISEESPASVSQLYGKVPSLGRVVQITAEGEVFVDIANDPGQPRSAFLLKDQSTLHVGDTVLLAFDSESDLRPIIVGSLVSRLPRVQPDQSGNPLAAGTPVDEVMVDGKAITLQAKEQIVLRCGESSITLRRDGKILIKGVHIVSRAQQTNRIKGGSVAIN